MMLYQSGRGIDPGKMRVRLNPGTEGEFAVIELTDDGAAIFIKSAADGDALIKAAVEAKSLLLTAQHYSPGQMAELAAPITDSERTCDQANPDSGAWCHRGGDHDEHRDTDGEAWRTDEASRTPGAPLCDSELPLKHGGVLKCTLDNGHYGAHSAIAGECRWLGHGDDARDENGDRIAPASVTA